MASMARTLLLAMAVAAVSSQGRQPEWTPQSSGVSARLRAVSAVSDLVVWASGAGGTIVRTADGGATWRAHTMPGTEKLDFRDIDAVDASTAFALSIGPGEQSRIYKTTDAGATWTEQHVNRDPKAFFDAMAFWNADSGIAFSDSVEGQFVILRTVDGGRQWTRVPAAALPPALPGEGAFAASGTSVAVHGRDRVWVGTGAAPQARVLRSRDRGRTWHVASTPLAAGASAGIFSVAFRDQRRGIIVGGDYQQEALARDNAAITTDGGVTWKAVTGPSGFRSAVAYVPGRASTVIALGPSGTDISTDDGHTWKPIPGPGFHALAVSPTGRLAWGVGEKGRIGVLRLR